MDNLYLLNEAFTRVRVVDDYTSLIWPEKYLGWSEFELYLKATPDNLELFQPDMYLSLEGSDRIMIIDTTNVETDIESGSYLSVKGYPLESLMARRIIWGQRVLTGNLQSAIQSILSTNIYSASTIASRRISSFAFQASTDWRVTLPTIDAQFTGTLLADFLASVLEPEGLGYKVTRLGGGLLTFQLIAGEDRSYSQSVNPYVVFSPGFDNLISSEYKATARDFKTAALVAGEGEGNARRVRTVTKGFPTPTGILRREMFVDARDISSDTDAGQLTTAQYNAALDQRGREKLSEQEVDVAFEGDVDTNRLYQYGVDFFLGDIVQVEDAFGHSNPARVTEFIRVHSSTEKKSYPTFTSL